MREGCREVRGDVGVPRMASAKLDRWDDGGPELEPILRAGGGERPGDKAELLRDCSGEVVMGVGAPFFSCVDAAWSAIAVEEGTRRGAGCYRKEGLLLVSRKVVVCRQRPMRVADSE